MRENDIHNLIEQQDPERKQRVWEKICSQVDLPAARQSTPAPKKRTFKWAALAVALVCVVTLSIVLPLALRDNGPQDRYCDMTQYTTETLSQTLKEYSLSHNNSLLYVDWYDCAEELNTEYAYVIGDKGDVVFIQEYLVNSETGEGLLVALTDNRTRVDIFEEFYNSVDSTSSVNVVTVKWHNTFKDTFAMFEYQKHIYYLQLDVADGQERLTEIIEGMFK